MKIIVVTTENKDMKETGFGKMKACLAVETALKRRFQDVSISCCTTERDLEEITKQCPDIAFLAVKYVQLEDGRKIWLSKYFEDADIVFTGSKREVLEYDSNKIKAKELLIKKGIKTAEYIMVTPENYLLKENITIPYPLFLKPLDAANGNGVDDESLVLNHENFVKKAKKLFSKYGNTVIAEKYLAGREFTVAVIRDFAKNEFIVSPIEIVPPENKDKIRILGEKVKNENTEELKSVTDDLIRKKLKNIAVSCFKALGARDFGRIDIKMDDEGVCNFIEANLVPGMTEGSSYFPKSLEIDSKLKYFEVIDLIINNAIGRTTINEESIN